MVRAKFQVFSIKPEPIWLTVDGKSVQQYGATVTLYPTYADGSLENAEFYALTPAGQIVLSTLNPAAAAKFEVGKRYYVDFSEAEA